MYHIIGKRWFQKSFGNTYHSVRILENGQEIAHIPKTYGYDDQYLQTAIDWLSSNRGVEKTYSTRFLREILRATWEVNDVQRERDL